MVPTFIIGESVASFEASEPSFDGLVDVDFTGSDRDAALSVDFTDPAGDVLSAICSALLDASRGLVCCVSDDVDDGVGGADVLSSFCGVAESSFTGELVDDTSSSVTTASCWCCSCLGVVEVAAALELADVLVLASCVGPGLAGLVPSGILLAGCGCWRCF